MDQMVNVPEVAQMSLEAYLYRHHRGADWTMKRVTPTEWWLSCQTPTACVARAYLAGLAAARTAKGRSYKLIKAQRGPARRVAVLLTDKEALELERMARLAELGYSRAVATSPSDNPDAAACKRGRERRSIHLAALTVLRAAIAKALGAR